MAQMIQRLQGQLCAYLLRPLFTIDETFEYRTLDNGKSWDIEFEILLLVTIGLATVLFSASYLVILVYVSFVNHKHIFNNGLTATNHGSRAHVCSVP